MKFIAKDGALTIKLEGFEILAGLRRKLVIPRQKIVNLTWQPVFATNKREIRLGGTGLPGVLYAGNWWGRGGWYFLYVQQPQGYPLSGGLSAPNVLRLQLTDYTYTEIWLTCQPDIGAGLMNWYGAAAQQPDS